MREGKRDKEALIKVKLLDFKLNLESIKMPRIGPYK